MNKNISMKKYINNTRLKVVIVRTFHKKNLRLTFSNNQYICTHEFTNFPIVYFTFHV